MSVLETSKIALLSIIYFVFICDFQLQNVTYCSLVYSGGWSIVLRVCLVGQMNDETFNIDFYCGSCPSVHISWKCK
jgi:hypothetical protein